MQTATSSFSKDRPKAKKRDELASTSNPKSSRSVTKGPSKLKETAQSTIDKTKSSFKDRKSKGAAKTDKGSRKRKEADGRHLYIYLLFDI